MSKSTDRIIQIQEQTGIQLVKQQKECDYYGHQMTPEEVEETLKQDKGYQKFLDSLDERIF